MASSSHPDYYSDLEVSRDATLSQIKKAYRRLSLRYHPDKHPGEEAKFQPLFVQISLAYEILQDEGKRAEYDEILEFLANNPSPSTTGATGFTSRFWSQARQQQEQQSQQQVPREAPSTPWYQHTFDELRAWAQAQHDKRKLAEEERNIAAERKREAEARRREEDESWVEEQARMEDRRREVEEMRLEVEGTRVREEEGWQVVEEDERGRGYVLREEEELFGATGQWGVEEEDDDE